MGGGVPFSSGCMLSKFFWLPYNESQFYIKTIGFFAFTRSIFGNLLLLFYVALLFCPFGILFYRHFVISGCISHLYTSRSFALLGPDFCVRMALVFSWLCTTRAEGREDMGRAL